jgi:hypothetical protein
MNCVFCQHIMHPQGFRNFYCSSKECSIMCVRIKITNEKISRVLFEYRVNEMHYLIGYNYDEGQLYGMHVWYREVADYFKSYEPLIHIKTSNLSLTPFNIKDKISLYLTFS